MTPDFRTAMARAGRLPRGLLLDAAREDQERRWAAGQRLPAEEYLAALPALAAEPEDAAVLVYGEVLCREAAGDRPDPADYLRRFPRLAARLGPVFEVHSALPGLSAGGGHGPAGDRDEPDHAPALPGLGPPEPVARGGMGVVFRATDEATGRPVAVKLVRADAATPEALVRFLQEGEILTRLEHPNIVRLVRSGTHAGRLFLVMEWVGGGTLADGCGRPLDPRRAAGLVATLAEAAGYAHARGVVHRDLKPVNVLLTESGVPKIADFGVARLIAAGRTCTATGQVLGTAAYMPPEQAEGRPQAIGPAADVYALGAVLYELLTGRPPFAGPRTEVIQQVLHDPPAPPTDLVPGLPPALSAACVRCLAKDPADRFPSAAALAETLRHATAS